jgi:hypothetical protein
MYAYFGASSSSFRNIGFFVFFLYVELKHGYLREEEKRSCRQNGTVGVTREL